jgi:predicted exporter
VKRALAWLWLAVVVVAAVHLAWRFAAGIELRSDLLALLPREEADPRMQQAREAVSAAIGRRLVLLVGDRDRARARAAADALAAALVGTGAVTLDDGMADAGRLRRLGELLYAHREALLSARDRVDLLAGRGEAVAERALAEIFGFVAPTSSELLAADPFLLLPRFITGLPMPGARVVRDEGKLVVRDGDMYRVLVSGRVLRNTLDVAVQRRIVDAVDGARAGFAAPVEVLRLGAVFFAEAAASQAIGESALIGTLSLAGTVLLIVGVFRSAIPLALNLLALGVAIATAFSASLALFGDLHAAVMLFGVSLIGVAVDYGLHYCAGLFEADAATPAQRLAPALPGIALGMATTLIGYLALFAAPLPGLRQIAVFSAIGVFSAFATVVLWLPQLDRARPVKHSAWLLASCAGLWRLWARADLAAWRRAGLALLALVGAIGLWRLAPDDDVRRLQSLSPVLLGEQERIQTLLGTPATNHFVVVRGADDETALRRTEQLAGELGALRRDGGLAAFRALAEFVPSAQRQAENRRLVRADLLAPHLAAQRERLGLTTAASMDAADPPPLTLAALRASGALPVLEDLALAPGLHIVVLEGLTRPEALRAAVARVEGVNLVDPAGEYSALFGRYRERAWMLTAISTLLMGAALALRYGAVGALRVMLPPVAAVLLAASSIALWGERASFFHAMALVLVLTIGVDYAIYCAESGPARSPVTMLAVWLAAMTTLLSFGLLAFSTVYAARAFGLTMLIGIFFAFVLSPLASGVRRA